ncbi:MAG: hypothetical protein C0467_29885 [Planctomycetaceae bacterium]|nr:hypothetical protein [Planctomycetaceae bacterium]
MTTPKMCRSIAALSLTFGLFFALPGCAPKPAANKGDKKDKDKDKKDGTNPNPIANPNPTPEIKTPEKIDTKAGVGKDAVDFLSAVGAQAAKASQLSSGFVKLIGLPVVFDSDKAKGYSSDSAEAWLRAVGAKFSGMGPMAESSQAGDVAVFRGNFTGGTYFLRMVREGDGWKVDWLSLSSVASTSGTVTVGGVAATADAMLQVFAASAIVGAICDKDAMPHDQRIAAVAAGLTPALRKSWATPFDGDKAKGYDYSPGQLGLKMGEIGTGAESVSVLPAGDSTFKVEVTKSGGAKATYTLKLVKGASLGQWLVESISP